MPGGKQEKRCGSRQEGSFFPKSIWAVKKEPARNPKRRVVDFTRGRGKKKGRALQCGLIRNYFTVASKKKLWGDLHWVPAKKVGSANQGITTKKSNKREESVSPGLII